jgi:hypothetical protein
VIEHNESRRFAISHNYFLPKTRAAPFSVAASPFDLRFPVKQGYGRRGCFRIAYSPTFYECLRATYQASVYTIVGDLEEVAIHTQGI